MPQRALLGRPTPRLPLRRAVRVRRSYPTVAGLLAMITAIERSRRPHGERRRYPATTAAARPARAAAPPAIDEGGVP